MLSMVDILPIMKLVDVNTKSYGLVSDAATNMLVMIQETAQFAIRYRMDGTAGQVFAEYVRPTFKYGFLRSSRSEVICVQ